MHKIESVLFIMAKPTFGSVSDFYSNNFDFLRFFLAALVIFSHAFGMLTLVNRDPLLVLTHHQVEFGEVAVDFFFVISGFLITNSWLHSRGLLDYLKKRFLRISPGLGGVLLFCVFVVGPLGGAHLPAYFRDPHTYTFFKTFFFTDPIKILPGVFTSNPAPDVNGPLWTIRYEFGCYLIVALLGLLGFLRQPFWILLLLVVDMTLYQLQLHLNFVIPHLAPGGFPRLLNYYLAGVVFYLYRDQIPFSSAWLAISIVLVMLGCYVGMALILPLCGTYILLYLAYSPMIRLNQFARHGDISYGVYLYGWPIQQLLIFYFLPLLNPLILFFSSLALTCVVATASWRFVENPFLRLKKGRKAGLARQNVVVE